MRNMRNVLALVLALVTLLCSTALADTLRAESAGMIAQLCGAQVWLQVLIAAVVTLVLLLATRPFVKKFLQNKETHTNADRVVGQTAVVTEDIDNLAAHGRVEVLGNDWAARSTENVRIQKGTKVQVVRIEGVKLIVTPLVS